jgi:hypothetical protein
MTDALAEVADDLYGLHPTAFIAARDARGKELEKPLATRLKELRRPAPAAWVLNLLVRERRADIDEVLDLGAGLREAQAALDREAITRLSRERRTLVGALARQGAALAAEAGHPVATAVVDAVAATLDAGIADPEAAAAIRTGRLLRPLETIGFEPVDLAEAVALPEAGSRAAERRAAPERARPRAIDDADAELIRARTRADAAVARAETDVEEAADELDRLEDRLREARKAVAAAEREAEWLAQKRDSASDVHDRARAALDAARAKREQLGG